MRRPELPATVKCPSCDLYIELKPDTMIMIPMAEPNEESEAGWG